MKNLHREQLNAVIQTGKPLILYFYRNHQAQSIVGAAAVREIDQLIAKNFDVFCIDVDLEPEIADAFSVTEVPETISVKDKRIHRRVRGALFSNQILDLLK
jgi:thioredoxin-like negative regulator of GroEL